MFAVRRRSHATSVLLLARPEGLGRVGYLGDVYMDRLIAVAVPMWEGDNILVCRANLLRANYMPVLKRMYSFSCKLYAITRPRRSGTVVCCFQPEGGDHFAVDHTVSGCVARCLEVFE